ncbi:MAG: GNAT family N-acetyltransferase [Pseudorhodobacter sp.]|nr:GNAT family N-acetyltransferase [Frankiaceae bacterium]
MFLCALFDVVRTAVKEGMQIALRDDLLDQRARPDGLPGGLRLDGAARARSQRRRLAALVRPDLRGHGVGDALVGSVIEWAQQQGLSLRLHVVEDNAPAVALYVRHGLRATGGVRVRLDGLRASTMSHDLQQVVPGPMVLRRPELLAAASPPPGSRLAPGHETQHRAEQAPDDRNHRVVVGHHDWCPVGAGDDGRVGPRHREHQAACATEHRAEKNAGQQVHRDVEDGSAPQHARCRVLVQLPQPGRTHVQRLGTRQ